MQNSLKILQWGGKYFNGEVFGRSMGRRRGVLSLRVDERNQFTVYKLNGCMRAWAGVFKLFVLKYFVSFLRATVNITFLPFSRNVFNKSAVHCK